MTRSYRSILRCVSCTLLLTTGISAAPAFAAAPTVTAKSEALYRRDAAVCMSRRHLADKDDCLSEASTARASREPVTVDPDPGRFERNALKRCEPLAAADRADCVARMKGAGTTTGSVAAGGIYRELVTRTVEPVVPVMPVAPAVPAVPAAPVVVPALPGPPVTAPVPVVPAAPA